MTRFIESNIVGGGDSFTSKWKAILSGIWRRLQGFTVERSCVKGLHWIEFFDETVE